jgi:hypothetical protein
MLIIGYLLEELAASRLLRADHVDSLGFVVRISLRANPDDRVVIDGVPISGHAGPSIEFIVAGCLTVV